MTTLLSMCCKYYSVIDIESGGENGIIIIIDDENFSAHAHVLSWTL